MPAYDTDNKEKELVTGFFDRLNGQDLNIIGELCAGEITVVINRSGTDEAAIGVGGLKELYEEYYAAFPDIHHDIDELVAEGDLVAVFLLSRDTHEGEFRGGRPTGNEFEIEDTGLVRVKDGKIVDVRPPSDMLGLFDQLGVS